MTKFIEVTDQSDNLYYINVAHIVVVTKEHLKDKIHLCIMNETGGQFTITTEKNYEELKELIGSA